MIQFKALMCRGFDDAEKQLTKLAEEYTSVDVVAHNIESHGTLRILVKCFVDTSPRVL